ncbi:MAG: APC family permease [Acidimicrobiales bacterium]
MTGGTGNEPPGKAISEEKRVSKPGDGREQRDSTAVEPHGKGLRQAFSLGDLFPLSVSSIGPIFSVAATGGVMAAAAGWWALPAIAVLAIPFVISSFVFRMLNRHFPHAGASYHWSARVIGRTVSRYQAWILILAYFISIPPIAIPAATYTLALVAPGWPAPSGVIMAITLFWICFAAVPLLLGAKPTATITKVFFTVELLSLVAFGVLGLVNLHRMAVPVHFGPLPFGGIVIVAVIAATVLDGWEIDSYAAEESRRPRQDPGISGIIGAFLALGFYAVLYPLMFAETPMKLLSGSSDPLALWAHRIIPGEPWMILIPILLSTAGGLWLTTYILTRALYAMGREHLIPAAFGKTNRNQVPHVATAVVFGLVLAVTAMQVFVSSMSTFFRIVLSSAGFFLLAEFFMDSLTAVVFLTVGHRKLPDAQVFSHHHKCLLAGSLFSSAVMAILLGGFFVYAPKAIGPGIDPAVAVMLGLGAVFVWWTRSRQHNPYRFHGNNITAHSARPAPSRNECPTTG